MSAVQARPKAFAVWFSKFERWSVAYFRNVNWRWPADVMRPIGEALRHSRKEVDSTLDRMELPIIQKITFGGQLILTAPEERKGYKGRLFWARPGNLIYSKIRVKQGSITLVPDDLGIVAVSAEYPVFEIIPRRADGRFLDLVVRSSAFKHYLEGLSHGGSTKTRIAPESFQAIKVPLPPLPVQRKIVARWESARCAERESAERIAQIEREIETQFLEGLGVSANRQAAPPKVFALLWSRMSRWGVDISWRELQQPQIAKYKTKPLGDVCKTGTGGTPSRKRQEYFGGGIPWVKTTEVRNNVITSTEETLSNEGMANCQAKMYPAGSIVTAMYGQGATRGRTSKLGIEATTNQACLVMTEFDSDLLPDFLWYYLMARYHDLRALASGNNQPNLSAELIRAFPIPLPPPEVQREIVERVGGQRAKIAMLKLGADDRAHRAKAEIEAMILGTKPVE